MDWPTFLNYLEERKKANHHEGVKNLWKARCATDLELFARIYFPHYCRYDFNELHNDLFTSTKFMERSIRRARAAPRGYAKSTIEALIKPIHDVCYGLESFIIILSNTQDQANQKLRDIRAEILSNTRLVADYGIKFPNRAPGESQYTVHCDKHSCLFASFGAGAEIRGVRFGAHRPTKIIADDVEHSEEVLNEALRKKYEDWFFQVVSPLGTKTTNISVIGTILHSDSLLANLMRNPAYSGQIYKSVKSWSTRQDLWEQWKKIYINLDDNERAEKAKYFYDQNETEMLKGTDVLWPQHQSYLELMKEMIEIGKRAFMKEKQNEPMGGDQQLFEKIHWYQEVREGLLIESTGKILPWSDFKNKEGQFLTAHGVIDPATGQTKAKAGRLGDFSCLLTGLQDRRGRLLVHRDWTKRAAPTKFISEIFEHHLEFDYHKFGVETNLYRNLLIPNLVAERKRLEQETKKVIQIPFYDIENVDNKEKRIYTLEPKVTHGWILFNRALSQEFMRQMDSFPTGDHDDGPDSLEMLWGLVNNRYAASAVSIDVMGSR